MKFYVCKHEYNSNESKVISEFGSREGARLLIEELLDDIQVDIQGNTPFQSSSDLGDISKLKYGLFVLTHRNISDRYTVFQRNRLEGYLFNSYDDKPICDLFVVGKADDDYASWRERYLDEWISPNDEFRDNFEQVMLSLASRINSDESEDASCLPERE